MQKFDHASCKVLITGASGTGKTTLWEKLVRKESARLKFVFDHQGEFSRRFGKPAVFDPEGLVLATSAGGYVVYDPVRMFPGRSANGLAFFCDFVLAISEQLRGRKLFACDELQKLTSTRREPIEFLALAETGRRFQVDLICISQAPNRIHNAIRNQITELYTFRQQDKNAIEFLEENSFPGEQIRNLASFKYLWRDLGTGKANFQCGTDNPTGGSSASAGSGGAAQGSGG